MLTVTETLLNFLPISRMKKVEYEWVQDMAEYEHPVGYKYSDKL